MVLAAMQLPVAANSGPFLALPYNSLQASVT